MTGRRGASLVEFLSVAPVLLLLGLGTVQIGLIHHGRTIVDYATFEAARTGAVNHGLIEPMRQELAYRLAPLAGGDGSAEGAAMAIARSLAEIDSSIGLDGALRPATDLGRLGPPASAFEDWGRIDPVSGRRVIPNSHLEHRSSAGAGPRSGLTLADANLLEIAVTHGFELDVPFAGPLLAAALKIADPENAAYYDADRLPLRAFATVRMQSNVWPVEADGVDSRAPGGEADEWPSPGGERSDGPTGEGDDGLTDREEEPAIVECDPGGPGADTPIISDSSYRDDGCVEPATPERDLVPPITATDEGPAPAGTQSPVCG